MPDIVPASSYSKAATVSLPEATLVIQVDDLNGQFAPQTGNTQPTVLGVPEPVQVEIVHTADDVEGGILHAKVDDWVTIIAKDLLSAEVSSYVTLTPNVTLDVTEVPSVENATKDEDSKHSTQVPSEGSDEPRGTKAVDPNLAPVTVESPT